MTANTSTVTPEHTDAGDLCKVNIYSFRNQDQPTYTEETFNNFLRDNYKLDALEDGFRWIHLPVNNMVWADVCVHIPLAIRFALMLNVVQKVVAKIGYRMRQKHWSMGVRPALSPAIKVPLHARRMELKCNWTEPSKSEQGFPLSTLYVGILFTMFRSKSS